MVKSPTVEDVARVAGVSRQTVSNVLNSPEIVREVTRERVRAAITQLGYAPSMAARRLRTQRSATIGIHLDPYAGGISGIVLDRFIHALTDRATPRGLRILVYAANDAEEELRRVRQLREGERSTGSCSPAPMKVILEQTGSPSTASRSWPSVVPGVNPGREWRWGTPSDPGWTSTVPPAPVPPPPTR